MESSDEPSTSSVRQSSSEASDKEDNTTVVVPKQMKPFDPMEVDEVDDWELEERKPLKTIEDLLDYWDQRLVNGNLSCHHFREWWREKVPKLLSPKMTMDYLSSQAHVDEEKVTEILFRPLERFLCGATKKSDLTSDVSPSEILQKLSELNDPPSTCGKLFRMGEPTYSCRECGHDPTCVLCVDCFKNSEHRFHKYKMSTSGGGGYCDCGDPEAWSKFVHCSIHSVGAGTTGAGIEDPALKLPKEIQDRARHVFTSVLNYAYEILTTEILLTLPADLTYKANRNASELEFEMSEAVLEAGSEGATSEPGQEDYVTIVYNDEFHTFDEVIQSLPRAVDCDRNTAIGLATLIDREGRVVVRCAGFQPCSEAKNITERITSRRGGKSLKVVIMHSNVYAHQSFALRLLTWLQNVLGGSAAFRSIFAKILLDKKQSKSCRLDDILRRDTLLWKQARTLMHHLLVTAMLLDSYETKKSFAEVFTNCYGPLMKDFMVDDHDHSFSVTSLSVQLYTVPTLAHHLIAKNDVLAILLRTFMSECERRRNSRGKLEFQRNFNSPPFKRAVYILFDLKYLLTTTPLQSPSREWNNDLRKGFLHGVSLLVDILTWMHGMDTQFRYVNQHIEFEFEWEAGFNLHMRLAPVCSLLQSWCATDRIVLIRTIRMIFKKIIESEQSSPNLSGQKTSVAIGNDTWSAECIDYPVHTQQISLHAPLTRLLAGLSLHVEKFDLDLMKSHEFTSIDQPNILDLMEPNLRALVFVAQVHAGMWRRNGYSVVDQVRVYHDPRCRKEMLDQDITMLQLAASIIQPDDFIINLVNKFNLVHWTNREFDSAEDESVRQTTTMVEEFFSLLVMIVGERYVPGVGQVTAEDAIRREIIHLLCVESMTHSALNKSMAEDISAFDKVIETVAVFNKPKPNSGAPSGKGVYELRPEFYEEYSVFFYHYTREEQSKSDETQRMRKKARGEPECHPPPPLPPLSQQFSGIANLMQCDVYIYLLSLVLQRADNLKSKCFSENQVHRVLHLIGLSLREEERQQKLGTNSTEPFEFTKRAEKFNIFGLMQQLIGSQRIDSHKHLLQWTIRKWQEIVGASQASSLSEMSPSQDLDSSEPMQTSAEAEMAEKKRVAAERRKKLLEQMKSAQKNFIKENAKLFNETPSGADKPKLVVPEPMETESSQEKEFCVCLGPNRTLPVTTPKSFTCILCLVEDELTATGKAFVMAAFVQKSTVLSNRRRCPTDSFMSTPLNETQKMPIASSLTPVSSYPFLSTLSPALTPVSSSPWLDRYGALTPKSSMISTTNSSSNFPILSSDLHCAPYTSSCGHVMHAECWKTFFDDVVKTERQRSRIRQPPSFETEKNEYLCPLCRTISNTVIPLIPQFHVLQPIPPPAKELPLGINFSDWIEALLVAMKYKKELKPAELTPAEKLEVSLAIAASNDIIPDMPRFYTGPLDQVGHEMNQQGYNHEGFARLFLDRNGKDLLKFSDSIFDMMNRFSQTVYRVGLDTSTDLSDDRIPLVVWQSCAFTIHAAVWQSLDSGKKSIVDVATMSSRQHQCLSALVRFCGIVGSNFGEPKVIRSHCLKLLSTLLEVDINNMSILEFDAFGILVALTFSLPSLFIGDQAAPLPSGNIQDCHILRLVFIAHIVQILLTTDQFSCERDASSDDSETEMTETSDASSSPILELLHLVREAVGFASETDGSEGLQPTSVWNDVKRASIPFLRCAALFYHHLTCVPGPGNLNHHADDEFEILTNYLSLPASPSELLSSCPQVLSLAKKWANHPSVHITLRTDPSRVISYPLKLNGLVPLPQDYSELINAVSGFTCPRSQSDDSRVPAMCLVCGEIICSQSYCCQVTMEDGKNVGACTAHAEVCGAGCGIFLRVRECKVVLLAGKNKGSFVQPPYVDEYGETDVGLRRGNPLHLCPEKYRKIYHYWLNHSIPEEIAHILETNQFLITTPWFNL